MIASHYRKELFGKRRCKTFRQIIKDLVLQSMPRICRPALMSVFPRPYLADYHLGKIESPQIQLATVVAASCALPPILSPLVIKFNPQEWKEWENGNDDRANLPCNKSKLRRSLYLTDGGVYDNLGSGTGLGPVCHGVGQRRRCAISVYPHVH